jgi:hypothetical protein
MPPQSCHFCVRVLWTLGAKEVVPQVEMGVNAHVGLAQSYEGYNVQDPRQGQIVQLQAIVLQ